MFSEIWNPLENKIPLVIIIKDIEFPIKIASIETEEIAQNLKDLNLKLKFISSNLL